MTTTIKAAAAHTPGPWPWGFYDNGIPKNATCVCGHDSGVHNWVEPHRCEPETEKCDCASFRWEADPAERIRAATPEMGNGLLHAIYRNHDFHQGCSECMAGYKALEKAGLL